ncbi:ankyrin repeat domain-containing protein [Maridesulfovibrio frigidus]|uniref:ankyrin repeat domain-containing protein n=1 Tax=Maridesulfovibrio frigidus TaxID=340956 RepID=UPI0004E0CB3A|nr:ankyrin repeat domain-containing protein [Maridesulfovibrio frigidus]
MTERNWTIRTLSTLAVLVIGLIVAVNFVVDPYGEFRLIESDYNRLKLKAEKTTALHVASKLYEGKHALVFGSSRTMLLSSEIMGQPVLNFSTSIYNNPGNVLALLKLLDKKQLANITHVYFLIDINSFHYTKPANEMTGKNALLLETIQNIGPEKITNAWDCLLKNNGPHNNTISIKYIDEFGSLHKKDSPYNDKQVIFSSHTVTKYYLESIANLVNFLENKNISTTYFLIPWLKPFSPQQQRMLEPILRKITQICKKVYNYHLNTILTGNTSFFSDPSHLSAKGLKKFIPILLSNGKPMESNKAPIEDQVLNYQTITLNQLRKIYAEQSLPDAFCKNLLDSGNTSALFAILELEEFVNLRRALILNTFLDGKHERLKPLLENGYPFNTDEKLMREALQHSIMSGNSESVKNALLLGADPNGQVQMGDSPLLIAARFSPDLNVINCLLDMGADPNYINKDSTSFMHFNESVFTLSLKNKDLFNYLKNRYPKNKLAKHALLLTKLENNDQTSADIKEFSSLNKEFYSARSPYVARGFLLNPQNNFLVTHGDKFTLHLRKENFNITPLEAYVFSSLNINKKVFSIINDTFLHSTGHTQSGSKEDNIHFTQISELVLNILFFLQEKNAIIIFN